MLPPKGHQEETARKSPPNGNFVEGRVGYLLILVALVNFIYPITLQWPGTISLTVYTLVYVGLFVVGLMIAGPNKRLRILIVGTIIIYLVFSILYLFDPTISWRFLIAYIALIPFQAAVILVLERFILATGQVNRDVLFAAVTVYLLIGAIFVPVYGIIELFDPGAIVDTTNPGTPIVWQQLIYYSFVTLTTTGYGDILPVSPWARVFANAESAIGVLFLAVTMARLVGLYINQQSKS